ncbi:MAG: glycosyltransferase family 2 protein [Lachnospiraceae bacterium]|nr:glycosyltransferase family 2 protein [Lachnospiraceae bacterium]
MDFREDKLCAGKVSAVIPVYNGEDHLSGILNSLLRQTYPYIEVILADDGSTDGTISVAESYIEKFQNRGYEYQIVRAIHKNASAAINQGLFYVTGEYLIWPDSDDVLEPESVKKRVEFLQEYPQYYCVRSLAYYFNGETGISSEKADEKRGDLSREELFWDILESKTFVCCGCYMLRTEQFFEIYPERKIPEYDVGQNFQMLLPFMFRHKCPTIQEELYGVAVRMGSHSRRILTQAEEEKRYADFEDLVDEIAEICGIEDHPSKRRLTKWKLKRRYRLALKYDHKREAFRIFCKLCNCGDFHIYEAIREIIWVYVINDRMEDLFYAIYRKIFRKRW